MKITKIKIENFKSIKDTTLDSFTHINMLFGHNNSGKSNILKFIELIFKPKIAYEATAVDYSQYAIAPYVGKQSTPYWDGIIEGHSYIFRDNNWKEPIKFDISIEIESKELEVIGKAYEILKKHYIKDTKSTVILKGKIVGLDHYSSEIKLTEVILNDINIYNSEPEEYFASIKKEDDLSEDGYTVLQSILNLFSNSVLFLDNDRYFKKEAENQTTEDLNHSNYQNWIHNISLNPERYQEYLDIIGEISKYKPTGDQIFNENENNSPFKAFSIEFSRINSDLGIFLKNSLNKRFPIENYGTGIQQVLYILTKIAEARPKILLIEELELNLSPKYQLELISHILNNYILNQDKLISQMYFTTHSPVLCFKSDYQIHNIIIDSHGLTTAKKLGADRKEIIEFYPPELRKVMVGQKVT